MVNAQPENTQERLDGILAKSRKFVCINDDIDHSSPESVETLAIIRRFYENLYPLPSSFELPEGRANAHLHIDELMQSQGNEGEAWLGPLRGWIAMGLVGTVLVAVTIIGWRRSRSMRGRTPKKISRDRRAREARSHAKLLSV